MEDFSSVEDEQIVLLVSNRTEIYDPKNKNYLETPKKEFISKGIAEDLNKSVASFKKRWKNIRDNYYKQKKSTQMPTGAAAPKNQKRNPILDQLRFLHGVKRQRRVLTNDTDKQIDTETADMHLNTTENTQESLNETLEDNDV